MLFTPSAMWLDLVSHQHWMNRMLTLQRDLRLERLRLEQLFHDYLANRNGTQESWLYD